MAENLFFATNLSNAEAHVNEELLKQNGDQWLCGRCTIDKDAVDAGYQWTKIPHYTFTGFIAHSKM